MQPLNVKRDNMVRRVVLSLICFTGVLATALLVLAGILMWEAITG